jgi:hypothetical protein
VSDPNGRHYTLANSALFTLVRYISDPPAHIRREELIKLDPIAWTARSDS